MNVNKALRRHLFFLSLYRSVFPARLGGNTTPAQAPRQRNKNCHSMSATVLSFDNIQQRQRCRETENKKAEIINFPSNTRPSKSNNVYQLVITNATLNALQTLLHIYVTRKRNCERTEKQQEQEPKHTHTHKRTKRERARVIT